MKKLLQLLIIRLFLFVIGAAFFGFVGYFSLAYLLYVVGQGDAYATGPGFTRSVWAITLGGGAITVLWFGRLGEEE